MIRRAAKPARGKKEVDGAQTNTILDPAADLSALAEVASTVEPEPHVCTGCIGDGPCDAQTIEEVVGRDCAGCGANPGIRCAKNCPSPHAWYDGDDDD